MRVHPLTSIKRIVIVAGLVISSLIGLAISVETKRNTLVANAQTIKTKPNEFKRVRDSRTASQRQRPQPVTPGKWTLPGVMTPPQPKDTRIIVRPNPAQVGETVFFYLEPGDLLSDSPYTFVFNYGDGSELERKDRSKKVLRYRFKSPGSYNVSVAVESPAGVPPWQVLIPPVTVNAVQVKLAATPLSTEVGMPVSLKATSISTNTKLQYRFSFGDNDQTPWQRSNEAPPHSYKAAGQYQPKVEIRFVDESDVVDSHNSDVVTVIPPPTESLVFHVEPSRVEPDKPVTFSAKFPAQDRHIQYRFLFDDGQSTKWQDASQITHSYAVGTYHPTVEVGALIDGAVYRLASAGEKTIEVIAVQKQDVRPITGETTRPSPVPTLSQPQSWRNWLPILILIVAGLVIVTAALVGYKVGKSVFTPKPTFVAYTDAGTAAIVESSATSLVDFELLVNPNVGGGSYHVITNGPNLVRTERSQP